MQQQRPATTQESSNTRGSVQRSQTDVSQERANESASIPVVHEQLQVGNSAVKRGAVRVYSRVVKTPVTEDIRLREEHVNVQRRKVDKPLGAGDITAFKEQTIEIRESAEEAVVQKTARVVQEVVIGKETSQRSHHIQDTVWHTEVAVPKGGTYDDYSPAYRYGTDMVHTGDAIGTMSSPRFARSGTAAREPAPPRHGSSSR